MAITAIGKSKVALVVAAVAVTAFGNDRIAERRMVVVAAKAPHIIAMRATVVADVHGRLMMAFNTVGVCQGDGCNLAKA